MISAHLQLFILRPVFATNVDNSKTFSFDLTIDGNETKEVKTGDVITVVLKLHRTDASASYTMYGMQNFAMTVLFLKW